MGKPKTTRKPVVPQQKASPFDFKASKPKHQVANARSKYVDVVKSRTAAVDARKNTLAVELQRQHKTNSFVDRRFAENNPDLSYEDKMLLRFQKMRQKQISRGNSIFNLNDDEEVQLTHGGEALSLGGPAADADDDYRGSDDESLDSIDEERDKDQSSLGFGGLHMKRAPQQQQQQDESAGGDKEEPASVDSMDIDSDMEDGGPKRKKTKAEIMAELVSKSKYYRYEKQKAHEELMDATDKLDDDYLAIKDLLEASGGAQKSKSKKGDDEEMDEFDALVAKLSAEGVSRARPQMALKDPEDVARAEAERLYQLERLRVARMNNEELDEEDLKAQLEIGSKRKRRKGNDGAAVAADVAEDDEGRKKSSSKKGNAGAQLHEAADDLDPDSAKYLPPASDESEDEEDSEGGNSDSEDSEEDDGASADEEEDDENDDDDDDEEDEEEEDDELTQQLKEHANDLGDVDDDDADLPKRFKNKREKKPKTPAPVLEATNEITDLAPDAELPFVFAVPSSMENFSKLLNNQSLQRQATILNRLVTSNHPTLNPKNREKLKVLYGYMMQRIMKESSSLPFPESMDVLVGPLFDLSTLMPEYSVEFARNLMADIEEKFVEKAADASIKSVVPRWSDLMFFKVMSQIWPVSDRRHGIVTPLCILMGQMSSLSRAATLQDLVKVLLHINIFHSYLAPAKRYASEPFVALFSILSAYVNDNSKEESAAKQLSFNPLFTIPKGLLKVNAGGAGVPSKLVVNPLSIDLARQKNAKLPDAAGKVTSEDVLRFQILKTTVQILQQFCATFAADAPLVETLLAAKSKLLSVQSTLKGQMPSAVADPIKKLIEKIDADASDSTSRRRTLTLFLKKPEALPSLTPDFDEFYFGAKRSKNEDKLRREAKKLKKKVKAEQKGAERELKRDAVFIEQERMKRKDESDADRETKFKEVMTLLQQQQAGMNFENKVKKKRSVLPI